MRNQRKLQKKFSGYTFKITHISAANGLKVGNLVSNGYQDTLLLNGRCNWHTCGLFICNNTSDNNIRAYKNVKHNQGLGSNLSATYLGMRKTN